MTDNIALGADGELNHILALQRNGRSEGDLGAQIAFMPGFALHADPALGLSGRFASPEGRLLELDARMAAPGGWVGLHLSLGARDLHRHGVLGFACRGAAPEMQMLGACLRSGRPEGFVDCFFDKHILLHPEEASHVDALPIHHVADLPLEAPWRELILFLPTEPFRLSLHDLRVFLV